MTFYLFIIPILLLIVPNIIGALLEKYNKPIPDWYFKFVSFSRRTALYLAGVFLGVIVVGRALPSTFPSSVIVDRIEDNGLNKSDTAKILLKALQISEEELMDIIQDKDIDFDHSEKTKKPWPVYLFNGETESELDIQLWIEVPETSAATLLTLRIIHQNE
jgi:hypothetical protein